MNKNRAGAFSRVANGEPLFLDGAMGTMLQGAGMPPGFSPEKFCLANPEILRRVHRAYLDAGSNIITTCTFGANPFKLPKDLDVFDVNRQMALLAREAVTEAGGGSPRLVAGDVGPTGLFARPLGSLEPEEMIAGFVAQIRGLVAGGVDLIFMETQFDLAEARAAVVAARRVCDLPIMVSMTFEKGVSLTGTAPGVFAAAMLNMGVDVIGTNCSLGPVEMLPIIEELSSTDAPALLAEPNAGLPELRDGQTVFPLGPEKFAELTAPFASLGVTILGGCCGTTPDHIRALRKAVLALGVTPRTPAHRDGIALTSRSRLVRMGAGEPLALIGERINPTGKPALAEELRNGVLDGALRLASEQEAAGATVLDVNVGAPLVDERAVLPALTLELVAASLSPLCLDSPDVEAIKKALPYCPGSALVNSISGEPGRMEALGPFCRDFGAPFILLPIMGADLPKTARERVRILETLIGRALELGIPKRLMLVDILAMSVSSSPEAARECLKMAEWCAANGFASTVGLSNISFGFPARDLLNATFLCMARGAGLNSCLANPGAPRVHEALDAMRVLLAADDEAFIATYAGWKHAGASAPPISHAEAGNLYEAVLRGNGKAAEIFLDRELASGSAPGAIVDEILIPAITEVGEKYEKKEYFLPQLIRAAEAMRMAFARLKPLLAKSGSSAGAPVIVLATVEGDIHDIGKNIVALMLGNHGFEVVDAGKDVPAAEIVALAEERGAAVIGLSALMTTTMARMRDTVELLRKRKSPIKVMVGGAVVTPEFAAAIGADGYSADAVGAVRLAQSLTAPNISAKGDA